MKDIIYYTPIVPGDNPNTRMMGECCDFECFERSNSICFHHQVKPLTITINWSSVRKVDSLSIGRRMYEVGHLIPTIWPRGQSVLDRITWCSIGLGQAIMSSEGYDWRLSGLLDTAIALLGRK